MNGVAWGKSTIKAIAFHLHERSRLWKQCGAMKPCLADLKVQGDDKSLCVLSYKQFMKARNNDRIIKYQLFMNKTIFKWGKYINCTWRAWNHSNIELNAIQKSQTNIKQNCTCHGLIVFNGLTKNKFHLKFKKRKQNYCFFYRFFGVWSYIYNKNREFFFINIHICYNFRNCRKPIVFYF